MTNGYNYKPNNQPLKKEFPVNQHCSTTYCSLVSLESNHQFWSWQLQKRNEEQLLFQRPVPIQSFVIFSICCYIRSINDFGENRIRTLVFIKPLSGRFREMISTYVLQKSNLCMKKFWIRNRGKRAVEGLKGTNINIFKYHLQ